MTEKKKCFIIQPFKETKYEERFADIFQPAIEAAGLEAYRVDNDDTADNLIDAIHEGIQKSDICFAEITSKNRNVWYEVGFATALNKLLVLVCEKSCKLPFDVQSRKTIMYEDKNLSSRHFDKLRSDITERAKTLLQNKARINELSEPVSKSPNLGEWRAHILTALAIIASDDDGVTSYALRNEMQQAGFNNLATSIALRDLIKREFAQKKRWIDNEHGGEQYEVIVPTDVALDWLTQSQDELNLSAPPTNKNFALDDAIPF